MPLPKDLKNKAGKGLALGESEAKWGIIHRCFRRKMRIPYRHEHSTSRKVVMGSKKCSHQSKINYNSLVAIKEAQDPKRISNQALFR